MNLVLRVEVDAKGVQFNFRTLTEPHINTTFYKPWDSLTKESDSNSTREMADEAPKVEEKGEVSSLPQKRVLPARERRESAAKRRASSPISAPKPSSTPKRATPAKPTPKTVPTKYNKRKALLETTPTRVSTPASEEGLPTKITDNRPLPTSHHPQPSKLSAKEYQSIADSAVLATSLHQSRVRWLTEGLFEKYWTKPSKKKGNEGPVNNPDLKTMQRLGSSTISVGPHNFDATIYTVRENLAYRHPNQYPQQHLASQSGFQNYQPVGPPATKPQAPINQAAQNPQVEVKQERPSSGATDPSAGAVKPPIASQPQATPSSTSQPPAVQSGPDPVIRMLATRAATNPELKALMKVVASSKASQEQLKLFQSHIDELNVIIRQQEQTERSAPEAQNNHLEKAPSKPPQLDGPTDNVVYPPHSVPREKQPGPPPSPYITHAQQPGPFLAQQRPAAKVGPLGPPMNAPSYTHYPPQQKPPLPEPRVKAIVLEFTTPASSSVAASQDRYLFPEYAVLDTPISGQGLEMVCSFFLVRKGSDLNAMHSTEGTATGTPSGWSSRWNANEEYYQPVTMTIKASQHRTLETIARAAKPLGEVQTKMKEIMQSKTRVKDEWLVMRLPKEKGVSVDAPNSRDAGFVDSAVELEDGGSGDEDEELKAFYGI